MDVGNEVAAIPLEQEKRLRNSYCLITTVSIGRHEKGLESLRGILKRISESSTSAVGSIHAHL